jgi:hypothetical protein
MQRWRQHFETLKQIKSATRFMVILGRTYADGTEQDYAAVNALQAQHDASPTRPGDQVVGRVAAGGADARRIEICHPKIGHFEQVEARAHVRVTENLRLTQIEPSHRIKGQAPTHQS